jgi:histidinol-phosphate aminotransferase
MGAMSEYHLRSWGVSGKKFDRKDLVPDYIRHLKIYQSGKPIAELARERNLEKITKLASNENPLGPSPFAIREMTMGLWETDRYPDQNAYRLKKALADLYYLKMDNIILGNGSEGIMAYIARAFLRPGDIVLTSEKTFVGFLIIVRGSGAKIITTPVTHDFRYDVEALARKITPRTRVIYIANPNNPTGTYITKKEFDYLMTYVPEHTLVILDEAYFEFARKEWDYPDSMDYRYDNVITLRTFSKAYGLAGIRVGYGFAHEDLIENLTKMKLPFEPNLIAQLGAYGALKDIPHLERTLQNNNEQYHRVFHYLTERGFHPIPAITNFISFPTPSEDAVHWLFDQLLGQGVIVRPLKASDMPDFLRVSIGTPTEMDHFFEAMESVLPEFYHRYIHHR